MKVIIAGDYCDSFRVSDIISKTRYNELFEIIKPTIEASNVRIVNFEFPIVFNNENPIPKCGPHMKGQDKAVEAIKYAGFNVCTLANNHILDMGQQCCMDTKQYLEKSNIHTVGVGKDMQDALDLLYIEHKKESIAIINCCEHEFSIASNNSGGANPLNPIHQYYSIQEARKKADFVLVIVHGGFEHCQLPSPRMQNTYRFFVDVGADAVVNHHQHCYSGYEIYKEKPIFYGLGNFLFDWEGKRNSIWNEGYLVELSFQKNIKPMFTLFPYRQCNETPGVFPLSTEETKRFNKKIEVLNNIICNPDLLDNSYSKFLNGYDKEYTLLFEPYNSRIMKGLYRRRLLPSFLNRAKIAKLYNYLSCESHLECVIHSLRKHL